MKKNLILFISLICFVSLYSQTLPPKRELRGVWIASVTNIDWPSSSSLSVSSQQNEFRTFLNKHKAYGINAIFIQIRPSCDAFYGLGRTEPWSQWLMGTQGSAPLPYYDPLKFIIEEAHKRGMEVHCWFNPYRSVVSSSSSVHSTHISKTKPEWNLQFGTPYRLLDPGIPDVRNYVTNVILNVVKNYDIEGVHFDDYFYPYEGTTTQDTASQRLYKPTSMDVKDWRRENVNKLVKMIYDSIKIINPKVKFGISPFGIYRPGYPPGITGLDAYDVIYCDPVKWLNDRIVDYIQPQLYWAMNKSGQEYVKLMPWWTTVLNGRHLYTGNGAHNMSSSLNWAASELCDQIRFNRLSSKQHGAVFFSSKVLTNNIKGFGDSLRTNLFKYPSLPHTMPWKDSIAPLPVTDLAIGGNSTRINLEWTKPAPASDGDSAKYFIIYRGINTIPNINDPRDIRYITVNDTNKYTDTVNLNATDVYYYYVTALDRLFNESEISQLVSFSLSNVEADNNLKFTYSLSQNYPNPFNPSTTIRFSLEKNEKVSITIYDILGNQVAEIMNDLLSAGNHSVSVNMNNFNLPSGVYLYRMQTNNFMAIKKMLYIK